MTMAEHTSVLIKVDLDDLFAGGNVMEWIWEQCDEALNTQLGGAGWNLTDLSFEIEGHEDNVILIRAHGVPEGEL